MPRRRAVSNWFLTEGEGGFGWMRLPGAQTLHNGHRWLGSGATRGGAGALADGWATYKGLEVVGWESNLGEAG